MVRPDESTHLMFAAPDGANSRQCGIPRSYNGKATSKGVSHMLGLKAVFSTRTMLAAAMLTFGAAVALAPAAKAQISVNIGIQPVCSYGYYDYSPYACAPMGFYGSGYFYNGIFLGMGPWAGWCYGHGWGGHRFQGDGGGHYHGGGGAAAGRAYASGHAEGGGAGGHEAGAAHAGSPSHAVAARPSESHATARPEAGHAAARPAAGHASAPRATSHASAPHAEATHAGGGGRPNGGGGHPAGGGGGHPRADEHK